MVDAKKASETECDKILLVTAFPAANQPQKTVPGQLKAAFCNSDWLVQVMDKVSA